MILVNTKYFNLCVQKLEMDVGNKSAIFFKKAPVSYTYKRRELQPSVCHLRIFITAHQNTREINLMM
jgi:hypothetical protein